MQQKCQNAILTPVSPTPKYYSGITKIPHMAPASPRLTLTISIIQNIYIMQLSILSMHNDVWMFKEKKIPGRDITGVGP